MIAFRILFLSTILSYLPLITNAQSVTLRSGEHGSFSRLVLASDRLGVWQVTQQGNVRTIEFPSFKGQLNIDDVFRRIDRKRIANISSQGSALELQLACKCILSIYKQSTNLLVIDVKDERKQSHPRENKKPIHFGKVKQFSFASLIPPTQPPQTPSNVPQIAYRTELDSPISTEKFTSLPQMGQANQNQNLLLDNLYARLVRGFGSASSLGLLDTERYIQNSSPNLSPLIPNSMKETEALETKTRNTFEPLPPILTKGYAAIPQSNNQAYDCQENLNLDVSTWSDGRPFLNQLSTYHADLYNTLGKQNTNATLKLIRFYLYFGFAAEARSLLLSHKNLATNQSELQFISDVLEERSNNWQSVLLDEAKCKGAITLWLSLTPLATDHFIQNKQDEIIFELSLLPIGLRQLLAHRISSRFRVTGNIPSAQAALRTLSRTQDQFENYTILEQSALHITTNEPLEALKVLDTVTPNSEASVEALIKQIEIKIDAKLEVSEGNVQLLETYAKAYENSDLGKEIENTLIQSLSKTGRYQRAFYKMETLEESEKQNLQQLIFNDLVDFSSDAVFAKIALERLEEISVSLTPTLSISIAERLVKLGFLAEGNFLLLNSLRNKNQDKIASTKAEIALAESQTLQVINLLKEVKTTEAMSLRLQLYERLGDYEKAQEIRKKLQKENPLFLDAFAVPELMPNDSLEHDPIRQLNLVAQRTLARPQQSEGMLKEITSLIDESRNTRETLIGLLGTSE
jgi:hypothetical protein